MPQRFLRPGIRNSERWNGVSFDAQSFYIRLLTIVDDFGRHDGRPAVLWAECFSIWNMMHPESPVTVDNVVKMLQDLAAQSCGLLEWYISEGKQVIQLTQWQERIRENCKERWPKNTGENVPPQNNPAQSCTILPPSSPPSPSPSPTTTPSAADGVCVCPAGTPEPENSFQPKAPTPDKRSGTGRLEWLKDKLEALYNRPKGRRWNYEEESMLAGVSKREDINQEFEALRKFRSNGPARYFPQSAAALLRDWEKTLDRARSGVTYDSKPFEKSILDKDHEARMRAIEKL